MSRQGRLGAGVAAPDDDDVEVPMFHVKHTPVYLPRQKFRNTTSRTASTSVLPIRESSAAKRGAEVLRNQFRRQFPKDQSAARRGDSCLAALKRLSLPRMRHHARAGCPIRSGHRATRARSSCDPHPVEPETAPLDRRKQVGLAENDEVVRSPRDPEPLASRLGRSPGRSAGRPASARTRARSTPIASMRSAASRRPGHVEHRQRHALEVHAHLDDVARRARRPPR